MNEIHIRTVWHPGLEEDTLEAHRDILLGPQKKVYWGVIHDKEEYPKAYSHLLDKYLSALNDQIIAGAETGASTYAFIQTLDPYNDFFVGEVTGAILKGKELKEWESNNLVPEYYRRILKQRKELIVNYWLLLSDLRSIPHHIFKQARPPVKYKKFDAQYGKYKRPYPTICDFTAEDELRKFLKSAPEIDKIFTHAKDFRDVTLHKKKYELTDRQAEIVRMFYNAYREGTLELSSKYIMQALGTPKSRLRDAFQTSNAWGNLIVAGSRTGMFRLNY